MDPTENSSNYRGLVYFNSSDKRIIVPKRNPMWGWTLNFARPLSYLILSIPFAVFLIAFYLLK